MVEGDALSYGVSGPLPRRSSSASLSILNRCGLPRVLLYLFVVASVLESLVVLLGVEHFVDSFYLIALL
jgi:hypothetical protein